jgi:RNA-binding protein YlmH
MKTIYEHFRSEEKPFIDKTIEWLDRTAHAKQARRTDFLDPRQAFIVTSLANRYDHVECRIDGGYPDAERVRITLISPSYELQDTASGIQVLSMVGSDKRIEDLDHGDYLGTLLGLGVKREKIGDIHVHPWGAHILVVEEMAPFFHTHATKVGKIPASTEILPLGDFQRADAHLEEMFCTVASLRLDGIVSEVSRLSRAKVLKPIQSGRCKVNWRVEENPSCMLQEGDVVSLQGFGRFKINAVDGLSKKGRIRLKIGKFV